MNELMELTTLNIITPVISPLWPNSLEYEKIFMVIAQPSEKILGVYLYENV